MVQTQLAVYVYITERTVVSLRYYSNAIWQTRIWKKHFVDLYFIIIKCFLVPYNKNCPCFHKGYIPPDWVLFWSNIFSTGSPSRIVIYWSTALALLFLFGTLILAAPGEEIVLFRNYMICNLEISTSCICLLCTLKD